MTKRTFRLVAIAVLLVVCLAATSLLAACNKESTYYLSSQSNGWTMYGRRDTIPDDVRFVVNADGTYSLTVNFDAGDSFAVYKTGSSKGIVASIFSNRSELTLNDDGKVSVGAKGKYVLTLDVESGELSYSFTAPTTPSTVAVTGVSLNPTSLSLTVGGADETLTATVAPENATNKNVTWSSSDNGVATVNGGVVHAVAAGNATITVTTADGGKTATCAVTVSASQGDTTPVAVTGVTLAPTSLQMTVGGADKTLTATVAPSNATNKNVTWSSSDTSIATVNGGVVHAVAAGNATITVTTADGGKTATCDVTVSDGQSASGEVYEIYLTSSNGVVNLAPGGIETLDVTVDADAGVDTSYTVVKVSGNESVATVVRLQDGKLQITAHEEGELVVKLVSVFDPSVESSNITITVEAIKVESITVADLQLEKNGEGDLVVTLQPSNATVNLTYAIDSGDADSITLNSITGHVVADDYGIVIVKVTDSITGKYGTCTVTVSKPVQSISVESALTIYGSGSEATILVTFNPTDATNKNVTLSSNNDAIIEYSYNVSTATITITSKATSGSAVLTVTSVDNAQATATCTITLSTLSDAVPRLSTSSVVVTGIGTISDPVNIELDGGSITSFTATPAATSVATVTQSTSSFTLTAKAYGTTTVSVVVQYSGKSTTLSLTVRVVSSYFYLTGSIDNGSWGNPDSESDARTKQLLLESQGDGTYVLTRDIDVSKGTNFYIRPSDGYSYDIKTGSGYSAPSNAGTYSLSTHDGNVVIGLSGRYTITLDLRGTSPSWTIAVVYAAPTEASIDTDTRALQVGGTESTDLTLTIGPALATSNVTIVWTVSGTGASFVTCNGDGKSCIVTLNNFTGTSELSITVTATITVDSFTVTATCDITLLPEGQGPSLSTEIDWAEAGDLTVDVTVDGWTYQIDAKANGSDKSVTYELVANAAGAALGTVLVNDVANTQAFTISATGLITAKMFGTVYVKVTAADGSDVYSIRPVTFYAPEFNLFVAWTTNNLTTAKDSTMQIFEWEVDLLANQQTVISYTGISDWNTSICSSGYLDTSVDPNYATGNQGGDGKGRFWVTQPGSYKVTLDLSGLKPSIKVEYLGATTSDPEITVSLYAAGNTWNSSLGQDGNCFGTTTGKINAANNYTVTLTIEFSSTLLTNFTSDLNLQFVVAGAWSDSFDTTVNVGSTGFSKWSDGTARLWVARNTVLNNTFTFSFVFNADAELQSVTIAKA